MVLEKCIVLRLDKKKKKVPEEIREVDRKILKTIAVIE